MPSKEKNHLIAALWAELESRGVTLAEAESRVGKGKGWLWDRKRRAFDVGEFWRVLVAVGIDPHEFFQQAMSSEDEIEPEAEEPEDEESLVGLAEESWRADQ